MLLAVEVIPKVVAEATGAPPGKKSIRAYSGLSTQSADKLNQHRYIQITSPSLVVISTPIHRV